MVNPFTNLNGYDVRKTLPVIRGVKSCDQRRQKNVTNDEKVSHIHIKVRPNKPENSYESGMKIFASKSLLYTVYFLP